MASEGRGYEEERGSRVVASSRGRRMGPGPGWGYGGPAPYGGGYGFGFGRGWDRPIETKPFFLTSEFWGTLLLIVAMAIATATDESIDGRLFWMLTTGIVAAYLISRGIAKSGTKSRASDPREDMRLFGDEGDES